MRDLGILGLEELVGRTVSCVVLDRGGMDGVDYGPVFCFVDGYV